MSSLQTYGAAGWSDYYSFLDLIGDVNADGRTDLVWSSSYQAAAKTRDNLVVVAIANPDGKADLLWNNAPLNNTDVDTYAAATGITNVNLLPLRSSLSAQILPPCASTRCFEIARPRPVPPPERARSAL
jgi:hypothetical protein